MLKELKLEHIGPSEQMGPIDFGRRLNFFTGDNGLGKSFLLDIAWWSLTRNWARKTPAIPDALLKRGAKSQISFSYTKSSSGDYSDTISFDRSQQIWPTKAGRPAIPGIVLYAGVDGGFSVWDPSRNYWREKEASIRRPTSFDFTPNEVWNGLRGEDGVLHCKGLIQDWVLWQQSNDPAFEDLKRVLTRLSPSPNEVIVPGRPVRMGIDVTDHPSLEMSYGKSVPLAIASAGMKRVCTLAYLLVWAWREHLAASAQMGKSPAKEVIFLIDEVECHLHPQWQRRIIPALLNVMEALAGRKIPVQLIAATHSPLVLASAEAFFDDSADRIFTLELESSVVKLVEQTGHVQGSVSNWLVSEAFGLRQARSVEAEEAIEAAERWMRADRSELPKKLDSLAKIDAALRNALGGADEFWPRWLVKTDRGPAKI